MLIDVHAHLDFFSEEEIGKIILNAKKAKVGLIITNSLNLKSCKRNLEIVKKYDIVKLAVGLYPEGLSLKKLEELRKFVHKNKKYVFAIGEIGMDFKHDEDKKLQEKVFREQLRLAEELNVPAIIHTRKAEREVIEIVKDYDCKKILHCFSGNFKLVKEAVKGGCYFSIPTNIVRSEHFKKMVEVLPREKILLETDAPYLSPFKDRKNEPEFVAESVKVISKIWGVSKKETEGQIEENFIKVFDKK